MKRGYLSSWKPRSKVYRGLIALAAVLASVTVMATPATRPTRALSITTSCVTGRPETASTPAAREAPTPTRAGRATSISCGRPPTFMDHSQATS
jgi:hypothetical protein